ncbi:MAG TPA: NTP transferase domain-containing protein [Sphingomicrobium sp.]|nr:NTP transferase domain-containing protein [Sphingomicrobium sp.]
MTGWTAILLAGSRPGMDPFAAAHGTDLKALIPVGGVPMVRRPVDALLASEHVAAVRVLTQQPERIGAVLPAHPKLSVDQSHGTIAATLAALCTDPATPWPLLVTTADHALLDESMIADFCELAAGTMIAVAVVDRASLEALLPEARRTWIPFKDGAYSGANLFALGGKEALPAIAMWRAVEQDRKKGWRLLWQLGPSLFLGALFRVLTLKQVLARVGRRLGLDVRPVVMSDPLACVDVDKQDDLDLAERLLAVRR